MQTRLQAYLVRAAEQKVPVGIGGKFAGEGLDEKIAAFLLMDAAKKERDAFATQMGELREELLTYGFRLLVTGMLGWRYL